MTTPVSGPSSIIIPSGGAYGYAVTSDPAVDQSDHSIPSGNGTSLKVATVAVADLVGGAQTVFTVPNGQVAYYPVIDPATLVPTGNNSGWIVWMGTQAQFDEVSPTDTAAAFAAFDSDLRRDAYVNGTAAQQALGQSVAADDVLAFLLESSNGYIAAAARQNAHVYAAGTSIIANDTGNSDTPSIWHTTAGGTSNASLPVFDSGASPVTDGTVSWDFVDVVPDIGECMIYASMATPAPA